MKAITKNERLANPFVIGRYAGEEYFCDRTEEVQLLENSIKNGRDIALISQRRMGKSGLIEHFFSREHIRNEYITIFVDIYATSSVGEFVSMLGQAVFNAIVKEKSTGWQRFVESLKSVRPALTFDAVSGVPTFSFSTVNLPNPELTLNEIFSYLESAPRQVIVAIDEFQEISKYGGGKAEALLRGYIQRLSRTRFIFAGSERSVMTAMFGSSKRPFYQSCLMVQLQAIPERQYVEFAMRKFADYGKKGNESVVSQVYEKMEGVTWFVQVMLNELFALKTKGEELKPEDIELAEQNIIGMQEFTYREQMARLSEKQRKLVVYLGKKIKAKNLFSGETLSESGFATVASLQSAIRGLEKAGVVTSSDGVYRLYDVFFSVWIRNTY